MHKRLHDEENLISCTRFYSSFETVAVSLNTYFQHKIKLLQWLQNGQTTFAHLIRFESFRTWLIYVFFCSLFGLSHSNWTCFRRVGPKKKYQKRSDDWWPATTHFVFVAVCVCVCGLSVKIDQMMDLIRKQSIYAGSTLNYFIFVWIIASSQDFRLNSGCFMCTRSQ